MIDRLKVFREMAREVQIVNRHDPIAKLGISVDEMDDLLDLIEMLQSARQDLEERVRVLVDCISGLTNARGSLVKST